MQLNTTNIGEIAQSFVASRKAGQSLAAYPGAMPQSLACAYAIQDAAIARYDAGICGWKVGRINAPLDAQLGTSRLFGPIWADQCQQLSSGNAAIGRIYQGGFGAAEAEFMFRIGRAPSAGQSRFTIDDVRDLVDAVFIGFEIASSPFPGINSSGPLVTISDFGNNNGLLIGAEIPDWQHSGLADWVIETHIDGALAGSGKASSFPGGPLESARLLLENLAARGHSAEPGLLISTGAVSGVHSVTAGQSVTSRFGDFGAISCNIGYAIA